MCMLNAYKGVLRFDSASRCQLVFCLSKLPNHPDWRSDSENSGGRRDGQDGHGVRLRYCPVRGPANWSVMRREGEVTDFHAATVPLQLYVSDTEAYVHELQTVEPSVYVVLSLMTHCQRPRGR